MSPWIAFGIGAWCGASMVSLVVVIRILRGDHWY
jgi:hypothetical protein